MKKKTHFIDPSFVKPEFFQSEKEFAGSYGEGEQKNITAHVTVDSTWTGKVKFVVTDHKVAIFEGENLLQAIEVYNNIAPAKQK